MVTCSGCESKVFIPGDLPPLASVPCSKCGHAIMMPMQVRQFELQSKIASGGHGKVYRAFDTVLTRFVAVKLMRKELESDPIALESFYREARACASFNHTNIIHIYSYDELDGQRYLVMCHLKLRQSRNSSPLTFTPLRLRRIESIPRFRRQRVTP